MKRDLNKEKIILDELFVRSETFKWKAKILEDDFYESDLRAFTNAELSCNANKLLDSAERLYEAARTWQKYCQQLAEDKS